MTEEYLKDSGAGAGGPGEAQGNCGPSDLDGSGSQGRTLAWAAALLGIIVVLHGLARFVLPGWLWGANTLYPLSGASALAAMALAALVVAPAVSRLVMKPIAAAAENRFVSLFGDKVVAVVIAGALALAAFWMLGVSDPAKNAWLFHSSYSPAQDAAPGGALTLPVPLDAAAAALAELLDVAYPQVVRGLTVALGVAFVWILILLPLRCRASGRSGAAGLLMALSGSILVFFGGRLDLALEVAATAAFLTLGAAAFERGGSPLWPGLAALCAALAHPVGLALLPAWSFLVWRRDDRKRGRRFWAALAGSAAAVFVALALFGLSGRPAIAAYLSEARALWATGSGTRAGWVLSRIGEGNAVEPWFKAAGWLTERVWGAFNGLLFAAPAGLALAAAGALGGRGRLGGPGGSFLGATALITGTIAFMAAPYAGAPRTWGVYSPAGLCATACGAWWLMERIGDGRRYRAAALGCVVLSLMHLLPVLYLPSDPKMGADALGLQASAPSPWDVRGRAQALEELSAFHISSGDTLAAAGRLSKAWDAIPNPLYLGAAGTHYAGAGRYDLAEEQFIRLVAARPFDVEGNLSLGILHAVRGDMAGAKRFLSAAYGDTSLSLPEPEMDTRAEWESMEKGPERERFMRDRIERRFKAQDAFIRGDDAAKMGLLSAAERQYRLALAIYPRWGKMQYEVHSHVGTIYAMQGRYREAAYEFLLAIDSYRNYPLCYYIVNGVGYGPARPRAASSHTPPAAE